MKYSPIILTFIFGVSLASAKEIPDLALEIRNRLNVDATSAFSWIEAQGTPDEVCEIYDKAVRDLYWLDKGAKSLVIVGERGISYCLDQAARSNPESALGFKAQAKTIAYNCTVFEKWDKFCRLGKS